MLHKLADITVSVPTIMELTALIGHELHQQLQQQALSHQAQTLQPHYAQPPGVAAVAVDGGRIMTRAEAGRGVHDQAWKETKNACLLSMSSSPSQQDPHPELPACFASRKYVETLVREMHATTTIPQATPENPDSSAVWEHDLPGTVAPAKGTDPSAGKQSAWRPQRLVRTCVCSMACSHEFGPLVAGEAQRRGFYQASRRAFLGDGQAWNWTLQEEHFPDFVAVTDFVHPLGYVYEAAQAMAPDNPWPLYLQGTTDCWQGRVSELLNRLHAWQATHPLPAEASLPDHDPRLVVQRVVTYLENNQSRMDYPAYRRAGLPVSTAMIESLIKEVNYRVKGTEKFWNRPEGAEYILQVRAATLSDDDRLSHWILHRPGSYFYRPSTGQPDTLAAAA
jgi:hypothetical protein